MNLDNQKRNPYQNNSAAQRLAAQPLGHFRFSVTILAGILKLQLNVFSLSVGQVGCSRVLGGYLAKLFHPVLLKLKEDILKRKNLTTGSSPTGPERRMVKRSEDFALLSFDDGVLYNNVFAKGDIQNVFQQVFLDGNRFGWEWDWPENTGPSVKTYPEVILGRSPWSKAEYDSQLPCALEKVRFVLDFDFTTEAEGSWSESFDFWITDKTHPESKDITCNLCLWTRTHQLEGVYRGSHETVKIGGRTYEAIIETPADQPAKTWKTLFVIDTEPRSQGSLELQPFMEILIERGLAKPDRFLATAELGNEVAYGKGRTIVQKFSLR